MSINSGPGPNQRAPRIVAALPGSGPAGDFVYDTATDASYVANNAGAYQVLDTGSADVVGPASSTDNAITRFDGTTGKLVQNSAVIVADTTGVISGTQGVTFSGSSSGTTALVASAAAGTTTATLPAATGNVLLDTTTEALLASVASVDMNTATASTLYTCPTGKSCVITKVVIRNASTSLTTASWSYGWESATFANVIANATHTELTGSTLYTILNPKVGAVVGLTTGVFKVLMNTLQGGAATTTMSVFGYLF